MLLGEIVIGSSVEAACYALVNGHIFVDTRRAPALFCKRLDVPILDEEFESPAWQRLNLALSLSSKRLTVSESDTLKIRDNLMRITRGSQSFEYSFSRAMVFDPTWVNMENNILKPRDKNFLTIDDFELSTLGAKRYEIEPLVQDSDFAKELHFYSSNRVDGAKYITDCVLVSELTQSQLGCFDYSDSIGKIFVERYLSSVGVLGAFMKYNLNGTKKYRKPKVLHVNRMTFERDNNLYEDSKFIKFLDLSLEQIVEPRT